MVYLVSFTSGSTALVAAAVAHFVIGYAWASAVMARPTSMSLALFGIAAGGAFFRLAAAMGTSEIYFAWAGPLAALVLADATRYRNVVYSIVAFAAGYLALIWLVP